MVNPIKFSINVIRRIMHFDGIWRLVNMPRMATQIWSWIPTDLHA